GVRGRSSGTKGSERPTCYSGGIMRAMLVASLFIVLIAASAAAQEPTPPPDQTAPQPAPTVVYVPYAVPYVVFVPVLRSHGDHRFAKLQAPMTPPPNQGIFVAAPATGMFAVAPAAGIFVTPPPAAKHR